MLMLYKEFKQGDRRYKERQVEMLEMKNNISNQTMCSTDLKSRHYLVE
jgi:hypothetical protein